MLNSSIETLSKLVVASSKANGGNITFEDAKYIIEYADKWSLRQTYTIMYVESANYHFNAQQVAHNQMRLMIALRAGYQAMKICCGQEPFEARFTGFSWMEIASSNRTKLLVLTPKGCFQ